MSISLFEPLFVSSRLHPAQGLIVIDLMKIVAFLFCFLATAVAENVDLRSPFSGLCPAAESCCCSNLETINPCVCGDHPSSGNPEIALFAGFPIPAAPLLGEPLTGASASLAGLLPKWYPTLSWRAPPKGTRARLSVWIL